MSTPNATAATPNAPAAPKQPVNTQFEPEFDSLPEDLPRETTPEAPRQAGAVSTAATPAPALPSTPQHDPLLVSIARKLGLTDAQIAARGPDELDRTVTLLNDQRLAALDREVTAPRPQTQATSPPPPPPPEPSFETEVLPKLEGYPQEFIDAQRTMYDLSVKPLRAAQKELAEYKQREQHRAATTVHEAIADGYAAMGPEYVELVGVGSDAEVTEDQRFIRTAIVSAVNAQPKVLSRPRDITAAIAAAGKKILGARAAKPAAPAEAQTIGGGTLDEDDTGRPTPRPHHINTQQRNPDGTVGAKVRTALDDEIDAYNRQATAPPTARSKPDGEAEDKPGPAKALRTAKKMLFSMNGAEE